MMIRHRVRPRKVCPCCRTELDGGPIRYRCWPCGRDMPAADAVTEVNLPAPPTREPVTFWGEVRKGLPEVFIRTGIVAAALETGYFAHVVASTLGLIHPPDVIWIGVIS